MSAYDSMQESLDLLAEIMGSADGLFEHMQALEARAIADVLAAGGHGDAAAEVMRGWAEGDPEEAEALDEQQPGWLEAQCERWEAGL